MIILAKATSKTKIKLIVALLDFEKKKSLTSDVLMIISTLVVVSISRFFTIKMNSFSNKDLLDFVHTLGEAYKVHQQIDCSTLMQWIESEDLLVNFFKNYEIENNHNIKSLMPVENKKF